MSILEKLPNRIVNHRNVILWLACCLLSAMQLTHAASNKKNLLIINSYNESAPWVQDYITPFMLEGANNDNLDCNLIHMNSSLIRTDSMYNVIEDGIFNRLGEQKPDYLVLIGRMAFSLRDRIQEEWGDVPMLFLGANDKTVLNERYLSGDQSFLNEESIHLADFRNRYNFTYIEVPDYYRETIDMMVGMQPEMKKLVFASDDLVTNMELNKNIKDYISAKYPYLDYEWVVASEESRAELHEYVTSTDMEVGVLLSSWYYSRPSAFGYPMLVTGDFKLISSAPHPVFSLKEVYLGSGALGGYYSDKNAIVEKCQQVLKLMLADGDMRNVPFFYSEKKIPKINYERLTPELISEDNCPKDTVFVNKPKTVWEQYSWQIIVAIMLIVGAFTIFGMLVLFQRKRIASMESRDKMLNNMPICYMTGRLDVDNSGKLVDFKFNEGNCEATKLASDNSVTGGFDGLFDKDYILGLLESICHTKKNLRFIHYLPKTDTYYDFVVCQTLKDDEVEFFGIDVTEKVKSENSLKETSKTLEMTLGVAHIIPWKWYLSEHVIACESNRIIQQMNLPKRTESTPTTQVIEEDDYFNRIHPDDRDKVKLAYQNLVDGKKQYVKGEFRILSNLDGRINVDWIEVNASVAKYDENHKPTELVGSLLVITSRKRQEANLIAAREAAKESDRLKSAFLANMSHEIRTPLNAIVGFSSLLTTTDDKEKQQKFINIIENNNQLLLQIIGDILDLSKVEANTMEFIYKPFDLNALIRNIDDTVKMKVQEGVVLNYTLGAPEMQIEGEPNRLSQVLINLLTNACKFTSSGSITFGYELRGNDLYFFVRDTGCGISKEEQEHIFHRFVKLNNFVPGTGLGLPISQSIIEKMEGTIGVDSKGEGKGSTFWFTIPYKPARVQKEIKIPEGPKEIIPREKVTILIAEDNESNYMLFESILGSHYRLIHAWDGEEAVRLFAECQPKLIIMDINMPKMDGYEATREIRKMSTTVPIIAVTAYAFASDKERIMENGFNSYVSKPINAKHLNDELRSALGSHFILL